MTFSCIPPPVAERFARHRQILNLAMGGFLFWPRISMECGCCSPRVPGRVSPEVKMQVQDLPRPFPLSVSQVVRQAADYRTVSLAQMGNGSPVVKPCAQGPIQYRGTARNPTADGGNCGLRKGVVRKRVENMVDKTRIMRTEKKK